MNINVDILYIYVPLHIQVPSIVLPMEAVASAWCSFTYLGT